MIPHPLRRPPDILGRRGASLLPLAIVAFAVALRTAIDPPVQGQGGDLFTYLPLGVHVALWVATGAVAAVSAFLRKPGADTLAFMAIVGIGTLRAFAYGWAWLDSMLPAVNGPGDRLGWFGLVCWGAAVLVAMNIAGWQEDPPDGQGAARE